MNNRINRPVSWIEVVIALVVGAVLISSEGSGEWAHLSSLILRGLGGALFVLFALWFSRAVYLSVRGAPSYALFGYSMLAFCLLCWGLAFFYPFPLRDWRDPILQDLAFHAGVPAPLVLLIFLVVIKSVFSPTTRQRLAEGFGRMRQAGGKMLLAAAIIGVFLVWFGVQTWEDVEDLYSQPQVAVGTFTSYYRARTARDAATFAGLGTFSIPHGLRLKSLERGVPYQIAFTPHARLILALRPLSVIGPVPQPR